MQEEFLDEISKVSAIDYDNLSAEDLLSDTLYDTILSLEDEHRINQTVALCGTRARKLGMKGDFDKCYKSYLNQIARMQYSEGGAGANTMFIDQPLSLRCGGWVADDAGVRKCKRTPDGGNVWEVASPIPIMPTELLENLDTKTEKIRIAFYKFGAWRSIVCDRSTVSSNVQIITLSDFGVEVTSETAKHLVRYISEVVALNFDLIPRFKSSSHLGWTEDGDFIPYNDSVKFDGEDAHRQTYESISEKGDYGTWLKHMTKLRKESPYMRIVMAASYAAPLVHLTDTLPFIVHLWGASNTRKTVALMVAASIWGDPSPGRMTKTLNMTKYSMLSTAAFLKNIPFVGDELQAAKNKWTNYDEIIMCLCEGIDRMRMKYDKAQPVGRWATTFLFNGEEPITNETSGGGVKNRVVEVFVDRNIVEDGNATVTLIRENYGHAGRDFVDLIKKHDIKEMYKTIHKQITEASDPFLDKQLMAIAMLMLADGLVSTFIFNDKPLELHELSRFMKSKSEIDVTERAYSFLINHIAANTSRFSEDSPGELWGKIEVSHVTINKTILSRELRNAGFEFESCKVKWAERGYLILNSAGKYIHYTKVSNVKAGYIRIALPEESLP